MTSAAASDPWTSGKPYETYMGSWSRLIAPRFVAWLAAKPGLRWLDIGCGTGALSDAILAQADPAAVIAVDRSEGFIDFLTQRRTDPRITYRVGNATDLSDQANTVDVAVSGLMLNFVSDPLAAVWAAQGTLRPGGVLGFYVWDYAGGMDLLRLFWAGAAELDPQVRQSNRIESFPLCRPPALLALCGQAGLREVELTGIQVERTYADFDAFWAPFLGGQGPAPKYVAELSPEARGALAAHLRDGLPYQADGSIVLKARAWAVKTSA